MKPVAFLIRESDAVLVSHGGLAMVGALLRKTNLRRRLNAVELTGKPAPAIGHGEVLEAMIALLCLGKPDYQAIEAFRDDPFFKRALGLEQVPSEGTLRQRLDEMGLGAEGILLEESARLVALMAPAITPCRAGLVALDMDVSPFDNSGTKKECVGWTYKKVVGYAPNFAYLGEEGYLVHVQLRPGTQHCQKGTPECLEQALRLARIITSLRLLVRLDSGNDDIENIRVCRKAGAEWLIKRNIRKESVDGWLARALASGERQPARDGKEVYRGETCMERDGGLHRVVFEVTRRTTLPNGQMLLEPEVEVATWWTSLDLPVDEVIDLYHEHGTSEQFHSELKTDMDLERLPSGKFATNALVLLLGMFAYNLLRLCGQSALRVDGCLPPDLRSPERKSVGRRRLRSVILDMMYTAAQLVRHANRWALSFWRNSPRLPNWATTYGVFCLP
jgi:hypothetical protein